MGEAYRYNTTATKCLLSMEGMQNKGKLRTLGEHSSRQVFLSAVQTDQAHCLVARLQHAVWTNSESSQNEPAGWESCSSTGKNVEEVHGTVLGTTWYGWIYHHCYNRYRHSPRNVYVSRESCNVLMGAVSCTVFTKCIKKRTMGFDNVLADTDSA